MKKRSGNWITIWLILVCVLWLVTGTYAAYYSVQSNKGVLVAKAPNINIRFSSNYLPLCDRNNEVPYKIISISSQNDVSVGITVCNYPQEDIGKVHETDIPYQLTAQLLDINGNPFSSVSYQANGQTVTKTLAQVAEILALNGNTFSENGFLQLNGTLPGGTAHSDVYTLICAKENTPIFSAVTVQMRAEPIDESMNDADNCGLREKQLLARLRFVAVANQDTNWNGRFLENVDPKEVDAFNYEISGTAKQTKVLSWDSAHVELSKWSREELPVVSSTADSVTIEVGGVGKPTSYRMQFYRTSAIPADETWGDVEKYVTLS